MFSLECISNGLLEFSVKNNSTTNKNKKSFIKWKIWLGFSFSINLQMDLYFHLSHRFSEIHAFFGGCFISFSLFSLFIFALGFIKFQNLFAFQNRWHLFISFYKFHISHNKTRSRCRSVNWIFYVTIESYSSCSFFICIDESISIWWIILILG